jgi:hypothetical protein
LEKLRVIELVEGKRAVDGCPRVCVLAPDASQTFLALESLDSKSELS